MNQKHGAIVVKHGKIVSRGINRFRNDPSVIVDRNHIQSTHAEIASLRTVQRAAGSVIFVARWSRQDSPAYSKPCPRCLAAMETIGVKKIVFTE
jgi:tRNA(Arg) A34 adenosine deaminase TadA